MSSPTFLPLRMENFDERRATQTAAWLLKDTGTKSAQALRLLMYLAGRESLSRSGNPITTDQYAVVDGLPVLRNVQDLIEKAREGFWHQHIVSRKDSVRLIQSPGHGRLFTTIKNILDIVSGVYGSMSDEELSETVMRLPECKKPGNVLDYRRILEAVGRSPEDIELIASDIENLNNIETLFGSKNG